jgi:hypothetical protein
MLIRDVLRALPLPRERRTATDDWTATALFQLWRCVLVAVPVEGVGWLVW